LSLANLAKRIEENAENIKYTTYLTFSNLRASAGSEKTVAGIIATATNMFTRFMKPKLLRNLTGKTTLNLDLKGKEMLVVGLDPETRDVLAPLAGSVLDLVITRNTAHRRDDPLLFYFDEAPTVNLPRIVNWLNEMRSRGLCTVLGFQNIVQMERLYGKDLTKAIWGGCATKLIYNPQEYESAKLISEYLGREQIEFEQTSHSRGQGGGSKSVSQQKQARNLLDSADLLQFPTGERIVINPGFKGGRVPGFPKMTKAYVPLREKPDLSANALFQSAVSQSIETWEKILPKLRKRAEASIVTDETMKSRYEAAKAFLPTKDKDEKEENQKASSDSFPTPKTGGNSISQTKTKERHRAIAQQAAKCI
jgi:type IV secretory pathway TraG/TraD family ATPase VirD4